MGKGKGVVSSFQLELDKWGVGASFRLDSKNKGVVASFWLELDNSWSCSFL
jgi:hypothetical protein